MFRLQDQRGVTLLELLIVVIVLGILLGGIYNTFVAQDRAFHVQSELAEMNQNVRIALEIMTRRIRAAACDGTGLAGARIQTANANTLVFTQDLDEDGFINSSWEWLGYRLDAANDEIDLCTGSAACGAWQGFVSGIQNLQFRYIYDGDTPTAPLNSDTLGMPNDGDGSNQNDFEDIREVEIQITAKWGLAISQGIRGRTLTSRVQVRNMAMK